MIDILVPVLGRSHRAQILVDSITQATVTPHRIVFICSPKDTTEIAACRETGAELLIVDWPPGRADFAKKINWAFDQTDSEWVFQGADDLAFHPNWDTEAFHMAECMRKSVVGTSDLHNPSVKMRKHSTHTLFRRSYIEEHGGTLDDSGRVFSEVYDHQFVDNEFCETAMVRNQWVFAKKSIVEHLHPHWGLAPSDKTYVKAMREMQKDMKLYRARSPYYDSRRQRRGRPMKVRRP